MKKQFLFQFLLLSIFIGWNLPKAKSQTSEEELLKKYWNYRDRFKKQFVTIGAGVGKSINIANIDNNPANGNPSWANTTGIDGLPGIANIHGYRKWGDATAMQGDYITVLATEYKLLKDAGKDVQGTLNELYYAIETINRLDLSAEPYFGPSSFLPNKNGFFIRDDASRTLANDWNSQYVNTGDPQDAYEGIVSDRYNDSNPAEISTREEMSQDHMIGLMQGFLHVMKFVDNVYIKPTSSDVGFYLQDEVKAITNRFMNYITQNYFWDNDVYQILQFQGAWPNTTTFGAGPVVYNGPLFSYSAGTVTVNSNCDVNENWILVNPVTHQICDNGSEMRPWSYAIAKSADIITGNNYVNTKPIEHYAADNGFDATLCIIPHNITIPLSIDNLAFWQPLQYLSWSPGGTLTVPEFCFPLAPVPPNPLGLPVPPTPTICLKSQKFHNDNLDRSYNVYLALDLAAMSGTWDHAKVDQLATAWHMEVFELMDAVLNNKTPSHPQSYYQNILASAPCEGPYNFHDALGTHTADPRWNTSSIWFGHTDPLPGEPYGEFNGNDYMMLYNLYQIEFKSAASLPEYKDNACRCGSNPKININQSANILINSITIPRRFPAYMNIDIPLKEFLVNDLTVKSGKQLNLETDLVVCNNSTLLTYLSGGISVGNTLGVQSSITVRKGSTLHIGNNGTVKVYDHSKILIEEGAKLIVDQGAQIQLLGDNAVLEIKGDLRLGAGAVFTFTYPGTNSGYVKFSRDTPWDNLPHILGATGCSIDLKGQNKNDKILEIAQDILFVSQFQNISLFKIQTGKVEFTHPGKTYISTDAPTRFIADKFISLGSDGRVAVWGQKVCEISNSLFDKVPIEGYLFAYGNKLSMSFTEIKNCNSQGLYTQGMGVNLNGTNFHNNADGWLASLLTQNSIAINGKFNDNLSFGSSILASPVEVNFTSCKIKNNVDYGIDLLGSTKAKFRCGEVKNNLIGFSVAANASLSMNTTLGGGYVDAQNNIDKTIQLDYAFNLDIDNGYNELRINTGTPPNAIYSTAACLNFGNCPTEIAGTLKQLSPVAANNNKWQFDNNLPLLTYLITSPTAEDKFTEVFSTINSSRLHFTDVSQSNKKPCGFYDPTPCSTCPTSFLTVCPTCNTINTPSFINKKTNVAVQEAMTKMDTTITNGHKQAVDMFHQVLKYPIPAPTDGDKFVTNIAEREMIVSLVQSIESNQVVVSDSTIAPEVVKALEIQDDKILKANIDNIYLDRLYGSIDKALINYVAKHRLEALSILNNVLTFVQPNELEYVTYIRCLINNEQLLMSKQINQVEFLNSVSLCVPPNRNIRRSLSFMPATETEEEIDEYHISLFPNPSSNQLFLEYNLSEIKEARFIVYDITGKILFEKVLKGGNRTEEITDLQLSSGIYLYKIITSDNTILKQSKLTIIK